MSLAVPCAPLIANREAPAAGDGRGVFGPCQSRLAGSSCESSNPDAAARWWVVHTRARHEKRVADLLAAGAVSHFLPLIARPAARARHACELPLFPGYLFLWGTPGDCRAAHATNRIAAVLAVDDQGRLEQELRHIYRVVSASIPVDLYPAIQVGRRCRVRTGPLTGIEGTVARRRDISRVFLAATFLGQSAVIEVDTSTVELID
jgi:transcription antitermination factor NusG